MRKQPQPEGETDLEARVKSTLARLRLTTLEGSLDELLAWARKERPSPLALIARALGPDAERTVARAIDRRLDGSGLPDRPSLETFDWDFQPGLDKALVLQLADLDFLRTHEDIVLTGTSGTGKSHIAKAIAVRAAVAGHRVIYRRFSQLQDELADNTYDALLARFLRFHLLVVDDVGLGRVRRSSDEPTSAQMLFALVDQRVGRASTVVTSNIKLSAWGQYLGDPALTMAILDRMVHHATRIEIDGPSYRDKVSQSLNQSRRVAARSRKAD
jgi:DNA replication protein DnaC